MTKKDKARLKELSEKTDLTAEESEELAKLLEYATTEAAEKDPEPDFRVGATPLVTMRNGQPTRVWFKDGTEAGAEVVNAG